jgi:hypothetical protein
LTIIIEQNSIHQNEVTKLSRRERGKVMTSALLENHFRKERLEKKQKNICKKGREDKADNITHRLKGVDDTAFIDRKTQYGKLQMKEHMDDLNTELTFRGLEESLLLGWKGKVKTLKNYEEQRDLARDKKYFVAQPMALFVITKL